MVYNSLFLLIAYTSNIACSPFPLLVQFYRWVLLGIEKVFLPPISHMCILFVGHVQQRALYQNWDGEANSLWLVKCSCSSYDIPRSLLSRVMHWWITLSKGLLHWWGDFMELKNHQSWSREMFVPNRILLFLVWFFEQILPT